MPEARVQGEAGAPIRQARTPEEEAEFWRSKGNDFFKFGDHTKAKHCYTTSIDSVPSAAAYANRALVCTKLKEWRQAEGDCTKVHASSVPALKSLSAIALL